MRGLLAYFVRHRTAANILMAAVLVGGVYAASKIRAQFFPDVVVESVTVDVAWEGAGPRDLDDGVVAVLEPSLRAIEGVAEATAVSREGSAAITLEFEPGVDLRSAVDEVETAIEGATLPEGPETPTVSRGRYRDRVTNIVLSGPASLALLARYADQLKTALFQVGVTRVTVRGVSAADIVIEPSEAALRRYDLTFADIARAVAADAAARPAGALAEGGPRVRAGDDRRSVAALRDIVIRADVGGDRLTLGDVARLRDLSRGPLGPADAEVFFSGGAPAIQVRVDRNAEGDGVRIQRRVEAVVEQISPSLPAGVEMRLTRTRSQAIIDRLDLLMRNGLSGLAIVLGLLFLFLSARTAFWVAAGLPTAMLAAILMMYALGYSLNMLSLFALIICLGIVVDDAIVVGERADALARGGAPPEQAAAQAAEKMLGPVVSASITTVIAFLGLLAIGGRFGDWLIVLPVTVALVVIASLIECFVILPAHMRHALSAQKRRSWIDAPSRTVNRGFEAFRERAFRPVAALAMRGRYLVLSGAVAVLISALALQTSGAVRWFFIQFPERGTIQANIAMLPGAAREDTFAMLEEMRRALDVVDARFAEEHGRAPVVDSLASLGRGAGRGLSSAATKDVDLIGGFEVELIDRDDRGYSVFEFVRAWREEIAPHPMLETLAVRGDRSGPGGDAIDVALAGDVSIDALKAAAEDLKTRLSRLEGVSALEDSLPYDTPELALSLTPKGAALGFTAEALAEALRGRLVGVEALSFPDGEQEGRIRVVAPAERATVSALYEIEVTSPSGARAALIEVARIEEQPGFASIRRLAGRKVVSVNGEIVEDAATRETVYREISERILPEIEAAHGLEAEQKGLAEQERDFLSDAMIGFLLCLLGIYLTLAWVFGSWSTPAVVLLAIPFGYVGAVWGHYWHGMAFSMFSVVGLMGMAGIIINDSIVLVTAIKEKAAGRPVFEAVVDGICDRLRAVFLTTVTTVGGLTPMLFETSRQALFLQPTVITLAYGLGFGMVIVLFVTPAMFLIGCDLSRNLAAFRRSLALLLGRRRRRRASLAA